MDQNKIDTLLAGTDTIVFDIERQYTIGDIPGVLGSVVSVDFDAVGVDYLQALKDVFDCASFKHEENAIVFKVDYDIPTKSFDLTNSYVRDQKDTSSPGSAVAAGKVLIAVFQTPGFEGPVLTSIELPFDTAISAPDEAKLLAVGIELTPFGKGDQFSIDVQKVPFKVSFYQPDTALENYIIDFPLTNQLIEI